jgi:hypothetical protein
MVETIPIVFVIDDDPSVRKAVGRLLKSGSRRRKVSKARRLFCQLSVVKMGYPGAQAARLPGVTMSAVVRAANSEELPEVENYL